MANLTVVCHIHNESEFLPYFIMHYAPIVKKMLFLDDGSTCDYADILAGSPVPCEVTRRESDQYEADLLDLACRELERQVTEGWVMTLCVDEFILNPPDEVDRILTEAEEAGAEFVSTSPFTVLQMPEEPYVEGVPLAQQFRYGCRANAGRSRILHRGQHSARWRYTGVGRHGECQRHPLYEHYLWLGDFQFAPRELAFERRTVDCARVKERDASRGYGMPGKPLFNRQVCEEQYAYVLSIASKEPWLNLPDGAGPCW